MLIQAKEITYKIIKGVVSKYVWWQEIGSIASYKSKLKT